MVRRRFSRGFTLVELLVVIAIIGVLIALLLPAVQAARESARNTHCKNNLHQLALGVQHYQEAHKHLPRYWGWENEKAFPSPSNSRGVWGNWFVHILPYIEQDAVYEGISSAPGGGFGQTTTVVTPGVPGVNWVPGTSTTTCTTPPSTTCTPNPPGTGSSSHVGHTYTPPPTQTCTTTPGIGCTTTTTGSSGTPPVPAVNQVDQHGIVAYADKIFEMLQCPSDPYKDGTFHFQRFMLQRDHSVTNYLANFHGLTDGKATDNMPPRSNTALGSPWNLPMKLNDILDGTSTTVLFAEAYSRCDGRFRLSMWSDCRNNASSPPLPQGYSVMSGMTAHYASHTFGVNWMGEANTYAFQVLPRRNQCNNWRVQGMHPGTMNVALFDGSVRGLAKHMSHQELSDPDLDGTPAGSLDPNPPHLQAAKDAGLPYGIWDRLLLPRDGEPVQVH